MSTKKAVICNIFGHEWNFKRENNASSRFSSHARIKKCTRCGKKASLLENLPWNFSGVAYY